MSALIEKYESYVNASNQNFITFLLILVIVAIVLKIFAVSKKKAFITPVLYILSMCCIAFHLLYFLPTGVSETVAALQSEHATMQASARQNLNEYAGCDLSSMKEDMPEDLFAGW